MKKEIILILLILLIIPFISAVDLSVEKISTNEALITDINQMSPIDLRITNNGGSDTFLFYTFFAGGMYPKSTVLINSYQPQNILAGIYPRKDLGTKGFVNFDYFIKGKTGEQKENMLIKVIELKDSFEINAGEMSDDKSTMKINIKNLYNYDFENIDVKFSSAFFNFEKRISLKPHETIIFDAPINKEDFKKLLAGYYTIKAEVNMDGKIAVVEGII